MDSEADLLSTALNLVMPSLVALTQVRECVMEKGGREDAEFQRKLIYNRGTSGSDGLDFAGADSTSLPVFTHKQDTGI